MTGKILIALSIIIVLFFTISFGIGFAISGPKYKGEKSDHFNGSKFVNPSGKLANNFDKVLKWMINRDREPWQENMEIPFANFDRENPNPEDIRITFVNHSTFLIQHKSVNILTDPIWSMRTSPFQWAGPKRMRPPGIRFEDLPKIHYVLISHNHYDHLDINTMLRIWKSHEPLVACPLGVGELLNNHGITNTVDLDWWQTVQKADLKFHCVPAQHFSGRGMFDRDATLWAGYVIESEERKIYFAGDTGYDSVVFTEIGKRFDTIDISLIPIGAYKPQWFMSPIHVSPREAVFIHRDVNSQKSLAMHFGTFPLADEGQTEPESDLEKALEEQHLDPQAFIVPREGTSYSF